MVHLDSHEEFGQSGAGANPGSSSRFKSDAVKHCLCNLCVMKRNDEIEIVCRIYLMRKWPADA